MTTPAQPLPDLPRLPVNWTWPLATLATTVVVTVLLVTVYYPQLPDPMPVHWNAAGQADGFRDKTLGGFLGTVLIGPVILLLTLIGSQALIATQSGHVTGMGGAKTPNEAHRTWLGYKTMLKHLGWYMFSLNLLIMIMLARSYSGNTHSLEPAGMLIGIFGLTALLVWILVREQKAAARHYPSPAQEQGKTWGIFYNDPEDSRIMVETGGGTNFTFNIGRPAGKVLAALLVVILPGALVLWIVIAALAG